MGSAATIPDGFTAEGENYIKAVALTDNNYQLTADGKGYFNNNGSFLKSLWSFSLFLSQNLTILRFHVSKPSIKLSNKSFSLN